MCFPAPNIGQDNHYDIFIYISISNDSTKPQIRDLHCRSQLFLHSLPYTWFLCCHYPQPCHTQQHGRHWRVLAMQTRTLWPWEILHGRQFPIAPGEKSINQSLLIFLPLPHENKSTPGIYYSHTDLHVWKRIWRWCLLSIWWLAWHFFTRLICNICQVFFDKLARVYFFVVINYKRLGQRELLITWEKYSFRFDFTSFILYL